MGAEEWTETRYKYFVGEQSYHIEFFNLDCNFLPDSLSSLKFGRWVVGIHLHVLWLKINSVCGDCGVDYGVIQ